MFELAMEEAGVEPGECLHVGDSYTADYLGAVKTGMQALYLDRNGREEHDCPTIGDLRGVIDFLDEGH
jgi:putative hydrolase of the HAD superfamily